MNIPPSVLRNNFRFEKKPTTPNGRMVIYKTHCKNVSKLTFDIIIKLFDYKTYTWTICVNIITARNFSDKIWCFPIGSKLYVWHLNGSLFLSATSRPYTDHVNHWPLHIASVFDYSCRCPVTTQIQVICYIWHKFLPLGHSISTFAYETPIFKRNRLILLDKALERNTKL